MNTGHRVWMCGVVWGRAHGLYIVCWFGELGVLKQPAVANSASRLGGGARVNLPRAEACRQRPVLRFAAPRAPLTAEGAAAARGSLQV